MHAGRHESVSTPSSDVELSESTASDLSISLTQSELEEDLPQGVAPERNATSGGSNGHNQHSPETSLDSDDSKNETPAVILERCTMYDFYLVLSRICGSVEKDNNILIVLCHMLFLTGAPYSTYFLVYLKLSKPRKVE